MNQFFTLAYPNLSDDDASRIEAFRRAHDPHSSAVAAHFTMAFGCSTLAKDMYSEHVARVCRSAQPIDFVCRYAMLGADNEAERAYVYLVPDEGYSRLSRMHDDLYRGPLRTFLRLDIPYVPHITLGSMADRAAAKHLCDDLNRSGLEISGSITALTVATLQDQEILNVAVFTLGIDRSKSELPAAH